MVIYAINSIQKLVRLAQLRSSNVPAIHGLEVRDPRLTIQYLDAYGIRTNFFINPDVYKTLKPSDFTEQINDALF